jgi:hypothetical protein
MKIFNDFQSMEKEIDQIMSFSKRNHDVQNLSIGAIDVFFLMEKVKLFNSYAWRPHFEF